MFEHALEGDTIGWWDDGHGHGADPGSEGALYRTGVVGQVCRHPADAQRVVALLVDCAGALGEYTAVVRPDHGHRPERVDDEGQAVDERGRQLPA